MENRSRAWRRAHTRRLKAKRSKYNGCFSPDNARAVGVVYKTPKLCSCHMCGNYRYWLGKTIGELRAEQDVESD